MLKLSLIMGFALFSASALAQQKIVQVKSGQDVRVWGVFNCQGGIPAVAGTANNGTLSTKQVKANTSRCGHDAGVMVWLMYRSNPGFKGMDTVYIRSGTNQDVQVNVK